ncbi:exocyst complex component 3-like protein [Anguilla anguilla]|uniref:exocyst complex component 3-like protein n=1 Tax=Anguilla anguilla TaxID=7936 RepID=UPI0015B04C8B|nr:exocyst complex component 3-like protein [Anguilla anguilla]
MSAGEEENSAGNPGDALPKAEVWPELERAERFARGAALKWASGVFCRPEQLERLGQYRKRESQRTSSIHSRLKSVVQSYLEGVGWGLEQLREARAELREVSRNLREAGAESRRNAEGVQGLDVLRETAADYRQLLAAVSNLPRLYSVPGVVLETERLVESRRLLEAHARLMELEHWQDEVLWQVRQGAGPGAGPAPEDEALVRGYFSGVGRLAEALARELWSVVGSGLALAAQNPTPFVSAVRIVEREEALDRALLEERGEAAASGAGSARPLPPGRPRGWRERFFAVMEEAACARVRSVSYLHTRGPGLASHLAALQHGIVGDLGTVRHLLEHCVPPHYRLARAYVRACHRCLRAHLAQVCGWELESGEIFTVLKWVLHVYNSSEMMGDPELVAVISPEELGPLVSQEALDQLQNKYVHSVRNSVSEWMQKALEVEQTDWQRDQEPDVDHEGFYHTSLPTIITQMLEENARVALMISDSLRDQTIQMGLYELESFLNRFREALVEFGKEHRKDRNSNRFYLHYLLAAVSNCIVLKSSTESLQQQRSACPAAQLPRTPPGPLAALDRAVRKACRLAVDELQQDLQPATLRLLARSWLASEEGTRALCGVLERHCELYARARPPCQQLLQEECEWVVVVEYARALMQKKMVCRGAEERSLLAQRMIQDTQQLRELFQGAEGEGAVDGVNPTALLPVLADFIRLKDPSMLTLEVSGLVAKYPDISEEHVSALLDVRGDVPREVRASVLHMLEQSAPPLPPGYRPVFSDILVPLPSMPFCLSTAKCT